MATNQIIILVVMAAAFYFLLLRPQQQQAKRQAQTIASLEPGTHIVTIGGIYATVVSVAEDRVRIAVADGTELEIAKRAVASILPDEDEPADEEPEADEADEPMLADEADTDTDTHQENSPDA